MKPLRLLLLAALLLSACAASSAAPAWTPESATEWRSLGEIVQQLNDAALRTQYQDAADELDALRSQFYGAHSHPPALLAAYAEAVRQAVETCHLLAMLPDNSVALTACRDDLDAARLEAARVIAEHGQPIVP